MKPTEQQKLIINCNENAVVIASPGSGKTYVISEKIKQNLKNIPDYKGIIAISYTNKASAELKNRSLSKGENPKNSFFGTIDKFNLSEIIIPFGKQLFGIPKNDFNTIKFSDLPDSEKEKFEGIDEKSSINKLTEEHCNTLRDYFSQGILLIETIGILSNYVFTNSKACRNYIKAKYTHIYVDEYQDSGFQQHEMFLKINQLGINSIAVGDLNQSIYGYSGKDGKYLEELSKSELFKYFKLDKNHRCHPSIINYSNYLLNQKTQLIPTEEKNVFFCRISGNEEKIANWIDSNIDSIQTLFGVKNRSQIAILAKSKRTCKIIDANLTIDHNLIETTELDNDLNIWSSIFSNLLHFFFNQHLKFTEVIDLFTASDKLTRNEINQLYSLKDQLESLSEKKSFIVYEIEKVFITIAKIIAPKSQNDNSTLLLNKVLNDESKIKMYYQTKENEVNILTLHKSKGLEYDVVLHLDLYEWIIPRKEVINNDFNNVVYENIIQCTNLHYVGITRAKKACFLISSTLRTNYEHKEKKAKDSEFIWNNDIEKLRYEKAK